LNFCRAGINRCRQRPSAAADDDEISAVHKDGGLTIKIARAGKRAPGGRKIAIDQG
jgi:hypothetical protein